MMSRGCRARSLPIDSSGGLNGWKKFSPAVTISVPSTHQPQPPHKRPIFFLVIVVLTGLFLGDIRPPQGPMQGLSEQDLRTRIQALESDLRTTRTTHEENILKFRNSCQIWKDATRKLALPHPPATEGTNRLDGIAGTAKDAETAIATALHSEEPDVDVERVNAEVLAAAGVDGLRVRGQKKYRSVGKHIPYEPVRRAPPKPQIKSPEKPPEPAPEALQVPEEVLLEVVDEEGVGVGHANEAFEAMEAMEFDNEFDAQFELGDEEVGGDDLAMDMGVD
jgi:hypothetical protein